MTDDELKQLVESNARTAQAILDAMAGARQERQELRDGIVKVQDAVVRLTAVQEGIANLLAVLDQDRPTILRKLTAIENKVDRLLDREKSDRS